MINNFLKDLGGVILTSYSSTNELNEFYFNNHDDDVKMLWGFTTLDSHHLPIVNKYEDKDFADRTEIKNEIGYISGYLYMDINIDMFEKLSTYTLLKYGMENIYFSFNMITDQGMKQFIINKYFNG